MEDGTTLVDRASSNVNEVISDNAGVVKVHNGLLFTSNNAASNTMTLHYKSSLDPTATTDEYVIDTTGLTETYRYEAMYVSSSEIILAGRIWILSGADDKALVSFVHTDVDASTGFTVAAPTAEHFELSTTEAGARIVSIYAISSLDGTINGVPFFDRDLYMVHTDANGNAMASSFDFYYNADTGTVIF